MFKNLLHGMTELQAQVIQGRRDTMIESGDSPLKNGVFFFFLKGGWGLEDEEMVYKVLPMAFKGESRLIFMQIGLLDNPT